MTDVEPQIILSQRVLRYLVFEATVSQNDTITIDDMEDIQAVVVKKLSDASDVTVSHSENVITITDSVTSERIVGFVMGV
ncbi:MAG: hypothetical protein DRH17_13765 [Deltaproteobacteria bacterium]|nr:MAG: hypothetical protein DRH17_13765 [Deltaproteobacteria bacterium]